MKDGLTPVRAATAETPEQWEYTSIKERITPGFSLAEAVQVQAPECVSVVAAIFGHAADSVIPGSV